MSPSQDRIAELESEVRTLRAELDRKSTSDGREDAARFLAALLEAVPGYVIRADPDLRLSYINRVQPGVSQLDVLGRDIWEFVDPSFVEEGRRCVARVMATGISDSYETLSVGPHGGLAPYEVFVSAVDEPDGRRGVCMVAIDLTLARRRDRALQDSEEKLRLAVAAAGIGLWLWTPATGEVEWDDRMRDLHGRSEPLDLPSYTEHAVHPDDRALVASGARDATTRGGYWESPTHRIVRPDGTVRWVLTRGLTVLGEDGAIARIVGGTLDVTNERALEEQVRRSQRLDAIGQLTTGIAHNFNNVLTVLTSTLEALARRSHDPETRPLIDDARGATQRGSEMIQQLMTFAGQQPARERAARSVAVVVERAVAICRRTFERHIAIEVTVADALPPVVCSESEVEQVLVNVLLNARDAVIAKDEPSPRIRVTVDRAALAGEGADAGVHVAIEDNGVGMSAAVLARLFEPFFTTKPVGRGTGLGLATSQAIVGELGGTISCTSSEGTGTTFHICLPAARHGADTPGAESPPAPAEEHGARARVLVVDDEPAILRAVAMVLRDEGFVVETATTGEDAVSRLAAPPAIDVVLLDRSMPGAPGESFLPEIRRVAPAARVVLFSGRAVPPALAEVVEGVLPKPATSKELVEAIAAAAAASTVERLG